MSTVPHIFSAVFGSFVFLFLYWRRIREDYISRFVFSSGFYILFGVVAGSLVFQFLLAEVLVESFVFQYDALWFWGAVIGAFLGLIISVRLFKLKFTEVFEAMCMALLVWYGITMLIEFLRSGHFEAGVLSLFTFVLFFGYRFLDGRYRRFTWYKSGRVGFAGIVIAALFFLLRGVFILLYPSSTYHIGRVGILPSSVFSFLLFFFVYNLSEGQWQLKNGVRVHERLKRQKRTR